VAYGLDCAHALRAWLIRRPTEAGHYVFSAGAEATTSNYIGHLLRRICKSAGTKQIWSPHSLRHRKGHQFADAHVAPTYAAQALGHSDPVVTLQRYYPNDWAHAEAELRKLTTTIEAQTLSKSDNITPLDPRKKSA